MIKRLSVLVIGAMMLLMLCSCDSEEVKQAKNAYAEGNYAQVVELLSGQEELSQEAQDILAVSEANVAYDNKEYLEAVKKLASTSAGIESEQFEEMFMAALDDAIANRDSDAIIELLKIDEAKADAVYDAVTKACNNKDYNGFRVLDGLVEKLEDGDLKTKLSDFDKEYKILRAESFLVGKWERQVEGIETNARVKIVPYKDDLVGRVIRVGDDQKDNPHIKKDNIAMQDFEFESDKKFIYSAIGVYPDGTSDKFLTTGKINYKKDSFSVQVSGNVERSEFTYKRVGR